MTNSDRPSRKRRFEGNTRERLASLETNQENLQSKADEIREGQDEIIDRLDDLSENFVTENEFSEVKETAETNEEVRQAAKHYTRLLLILSGAAGTIGGIAVTVIP